MGFHKSIRQILKHKTQRLKTSHMNINVIHTTQTCITISKSEIWSCDLMETRVKRLVNVIISQLLSVQETSYAIRFNFLVCLVCSKNHYSVFGLLEIIKHFLCFF